MNANLQGTDIFISIPPGLLTCGIYNATVTFKQSGSLCVSDPQDVMIDIDDTEDPVLVCPSDLVMECVVGSNYVAQINTWLATASATDNCDVTLNNSYNGTSVPRG